MLLSFQVVLLVLGMIGASFEVLCTMEGKIDSPVDSPLPDHFL